VKAASKTESSRPPLLTIHIRCSTGKISNYLLPITFEAIPTDGYAVKKAMLIVVRNGP